MFGYFANPQYLIPNVLLLPPCDALNSDTQLDRPLVHDGFRIIMSISITLGIELRRLGFPTYILVLCSVQIP